MKKAVAVAMASLMLLATLAVVSATSVNAAQCPKAQINDWFADLRFNGFYGMGKSIDDGNMTQPGQVAGSLDASKRTSNPQVGEGYYFELDAITQQLYVDYLKANGFNHSSVFGNPEVNMSLAQWTLNISAKGITPSDVIVYAGYGHQNASTVMDQRNFTQEADNISAALETVPSAYLMSMAGRWVGGHWTDQDLVVTNFPAKTPAAIQFNKTGVYDLSFYLANDKTGKVITPKLTMIVVVIE